MFFKKLTAAATIAGGGERLPALDGLRGLAVLLVLLDHASDAGMRVFPGADLNRAGKIGVYLFFVLSAFLLTHQFSLWRNEDFFQPAKWMRYTRRRFLRVFPVYAAVLVALMFMGKLTLGQVGQHLALREGVEQFWTIPVEVKYYLLLPPIAFAIFFAPRRGVLAVLGWSAVALVSAAALLFGERWWSLRDAVWLAPSIAPFLLGSALALAHGALESDPARRERLRPFLAFGALCAAAVLLTRLPAVHAALFSSKSLLGKEWNPLVCGVCWSVFLLGVLHGGPILLRAMSVLPLRWLGWISFSAYLWHHKFLSDVDDFPAPAPVRLLIYLAIVTSVASVSYLLFERPLATRVSGKMGGGKAKGRALEDRSAESVTDAIARTTQPSVIAAVASVPLK